MNKIITINLGMVNCYLVKNGDNYILTDTGATENRKILLKNLEAAGCIPGKLKLIILTHGHSDHIGNASFISEMYNAKIAMNKYDEEMIECRDVFKNVITKGLLSKILIKFFTKAQYLKEEDKFKPDLYMEEGTSLSGYGIDARVIGLPGHTNGSVGVLTAEGGLICGDILSNFGKPSVHFIIENEGDIKNSIDRIKKSSIQTIYPGHGRPFDIKELS